MAVKKAATKTKPTDFDSVIKKELSKYKDSDFVPVWQALQALRNACTSLGYTYSIEPFMVDVRDAHRTVAVTVKVYTKDGKLFRSGFGVSTRNTYIFRGTIKDAAMEAAQTVAIGKALATIGVSTNMLASKEEMELFSHVKEFNLQAHMDKVLNMFKQLPDATKQRAKKAGLTRSELIDLVDPDSDDLSVFDTRLNEYINRKLGA